MEGIRYVLKNIGEQVPLYDRVKKMYMLVIDGNPVDIPENVFKNLFELKTEKLIEKPMPSVDFGQMTLMYNQMKSQILEFKKLGMTEETVFEMTKNVLIATQMGNYVDEAQKLIHEIFESV